MSDDDKTLAYLKRVMVDLHETRRQLEEAESRAKEPIAIIGMSCRLPGGVRTPEELWELVAAGRDAISGFPDDRNWDLDVLNDPDPDRPGSSYAQGGGFVDGVSEFDAEFFGVDEREASLMDPQQRLLLEASWEALERAGIDPTALRGSRTGVFMGISALHYAGLVIETSESAEGYIATGVAGSMVPGRVAHTLGLEGPSMAVDAACSSSSVALHTACQSLRARDCSMALAGGATILSTPALQLQFGKQQLFAISEDARCKSFADAADGAGFSEGLGLVVLERLSDARRLGHPVLAVVRGSAINHDGASNGLTAPNGLSHERVIRDALSSAGVTPAQVDAVEGHGMGTVLGDPIEGQALLAAYGRDRDPERPLWLGSVKSNLGHTQAASGIAGVIKMVMAMRNGVLPKTLHVDEPTRHIDWSSGAMELLTEPVAWEKTGDRRRAAVHSFGMSGTNAHIVLEDVEADPEPVKLAPEGDPAALVGVGPDALPWIVSGRGVAGLRRQARAVADFAAASDELDAVDVASSLALSRAALSHRAVVVGGDRQRLARDLAAVADGDEAGPLVATGTVSTGRGGTAFVFSDDTEPRAGSGRALLDSSPAFAAELKRCDAALAPLLGWSPLDRLGDESPAGEGAAAATRALTFALQASLAALWRTCGVTPTAVVGLGAGEIAAAYVAGALSLPDAAQIAAADPTAGVPSGTVAQAASVPIYSAFDEAIAAGIRVFVEVGAEPSIAAELRRSVDEELGADASAVVVETASRGDDGLQGFLAALGQLWVSGVAVDWKAVFAGSGGRRVQLPTYAFDRRRYWLDEVPSWIANPATVG